MISSPTKAPPGGDSGQEDSIRQILLECMQPGRYQPRREMQQEALAELAESIRQQGIIQPLVVRRLEADRYEIIAGERRWRAARLAGLEKVPALVRVLDDRSALAVALVENIQREDLNPIEEARALQRLLDEFELSQQAVADLVGRSRPAVANLLRLLRLEPDIQEKVERGELEMGHARCLLGLSAEEQHKAARQIIALGLTVRQAETLVRRIQEGEPSEEPGSRALDPDVARLQESLAERLGATVKIHHGAAGRGRLEIRYSNLDELDGILAKIN